MLKRDLFGVCPLCPQWDLLSSGPLFQISLGAYSPPPFLCLEELQLFNYHYGHHLTIIPPSFDHRYYQSCIIKEIEYNVLIILWIFLFNHQKSSKIKDLLVFMSSYFSRIIKVTKFRYRVSKIRTFRYLSKKIVIPCFWSHKMQKRI